jgi:hypothetical protein
MLWDVPLVTRNSVLFFWSAADPEDNHGAGGCARAWVEGYVWVADTSNEIVGGGRIPHHRTG